MQQVADGAKRGLDDSSGVSSSSSAATMADIMKKMAKLLIAHEGEINTLREATEVSIFIVSEDWKRVTLATRKKWNEDKPESGAHPQGPLKLLLFAQWLNFLATASSSLPQGSLKAKVEQAGNAIIKMEPALVEQSLFRVQSKFKEPLEGKPWIWNIVLSTCATPEFAASLHTLCNYEVSVALKKQGISFMPSKHKNGGLSKELQAWLDGKGSQGSAAKRSRSGKSK